jgi:hypothetical protein
MSSLMTMQRTAACRSWTCRTEDIWWDMVHTAGSAAFIFRKLQGLALHACAGPATLCLDMDLVFASFFVPHVSGRCAASGQNLFTRDSKFV